ncbi:MAG: copper chaperone PCu(A)C [Gammaproteobacteria bacterium]|jgi:copper(I)-binding protein
MNACSLFRLIAVALACLPGAAAACDGLSATGAWVREPPPVANVAAGYVTLENTGDEPLAIKHIESECCGSVMMHDTISDGDRVRMSHLGSLRLEVGETVQFAPGGKHLMLMAPQRPLRHGDSVRLDFVCTDGGTARIEFDVLKPQ